MTLVPTEILGRKVTWYARLKHRIWPKGYQAPSDGIHHIEATDLFVVSEGEGSDGEPAFWVNPIGVGGRVLAGDICYTEDGISRYVESEFGVTPHWMKKQEGA